MAVLGIDLGGTKLSSAVFHSDGRILYKDVQKLDKNTEGAIGELIKQRTTFILKKAEELGEKIEALGCCIPGISYKDRGTVWAPNIPGWEDFPLKALFEEAVGDGVIVKVDSDRVCCILGEAWQGAARDVNNAVFLAVGTGIGAGILANGRVLRGAHDVSGAIGWWGLDKDYKEKYRNFGCFEYHASGDGVARVARELLQSEKDYMGVMREKPLEEITSYDVFENYDSGDMIAVKTLDTAVSYWAMAVANIVSLFDPSKIIFGGGVFGPAVRFLDRIHEEARKNAQPITIEKVKIVPSQLGGDAVLIGAGFLALSSLVKNNEINPVK